MRRLRHRLFVLLIANLVSAATVVAEDHESGLHPEPAIVTSPGAAVRSGPGESYYLTDTFPEDTAVEVYRRQPDGWCAIRPPADSFSWVFAQHVRLVGDGLAEISKDDVAARVGSRLSSQRNVVQVRLRKGETVAILGRDERDGGLWYRIAPPAGEFRWVQAKDIGLSARKDHAAEPSSLVTTASLEEAVSEPADGKSTDVTAPPLAKQDAATPVAPTDDKWSAAKSASPATNNASPVTDITPIGPGSATSADLSEQLSDLELRLSRMVSEPPATWNVAPLEQAAEQLLSRADTVADRDAVKVTLAKIDRFAAIGRRYAGTSVEGQVEDSLRRKSRVESQNNPPVVDGQPAASSQYDAVGILRPVVSRRPGAPQFALVNGQGQVVTFVTPTPDVNLQPYVGQRIGVTGNRGYIPEFRRAHVTAGRVTPINERMLR